MSIEREKQRSLGIIEKNNRKGRQRSKTFFLYQRFKKKVRTIVSSVIQTGAHRLSIIKLSDFCEPAANSLS